VIGTSGTTRSSSADLAVDKTLGVDPFTVRGEVDMRRLLPLLLVAVCVLNSAGCLINIYSSDPNKRILELLNNSEDLRVIQNEWERIWFTDQPSHLTPERVHGGIQ
jgi:hypothetical protein